MVVRGRLKRIAGGSRQDSLEVVVEVEPSLRFHVVEELLPWAAFSTGKMTTAETEQAQFSPWNSRFNWPSVTSTSNCFSW